MVLSVQQGEQTPKEKQKQQELERSYMRTWDKDSTDKRNKPK